MRFKEVGKKIQSTPIITYFPWAKLGTPENTINNSNGYL